LSPPPCYRAADYHSNPPTTAKSRLERRRNPTTDGPVDSGEGQQIHATLGIIVEAHRYPATGVWRPAALAERVEMKPVDEIDSSADPIPTGTRSGDSTRPQVSRYRGGNSNSRLGSCDRRDDCIDSRLDGRAATAPGRL